MLNGQRVELLWNKVENGSWTEERDDGRRYCGLCGSLMGREIFWSGQGKPPRTEESDWSVGNTWKGQETEGRSLESRSRR